MYIVCACVIVHKELRYSDRRNLHKNVTLREYESGVKNYSATRIVHHDVHGQDGPVHESARTHAQTQTDARAYAESPSFTVLVNKHCIRLVISGG